ncbi:MAG: DUF192 domain-containing protein [Ignavibacteria bacterium]|nr:DUF192 domain-containing protein [Ignavibacteria bacterium]
MKKEPEKKRPNFTIIILALAVTAAAGYFIYTMTNDKPQYKVNTENIQKQKEVTEPQFKNQGELTFLTVKGKELSKINIELADTERKRMQGLMYRKTMDENNGMLFVFPVSELQSFWMKNTPLPLDIMFVNENKEIVKIHSNTTPYSEQSYPSLKKAMYVVEVIAGYAEKHNISEGDKIEFKVTNY